VVFPAIPAFGRLKQEDWEPKISLGTTAKTSFKKKTKQDKLV
jgi:hypothetical protein